MNLLNGKHIIGESDNNLSHVGVLNQFVFGDGMFIRQLAFAYFPFSVIFIYSEYMILFVLKGDISDNSIHLY
jgi:hypothetical protein